MTSTPQTYPRGWFLICFSDELAVGEVLPKRYFGRDFVLYRSESGSPRLLDAYCPHLGAHLGHGGRVCGEQLRCPFHAWQFDGAGRCVEVPYAKRIPKAARVGSHLLRERDGLLMLYFDPASGDGAEPSYEPPAIEEVGAQHWSSWERREIKVQTPGREVMENVADVAHFGPVHNNGMEHFEVAFEGPLATQKTIVTGEDRLGAPTRMTTVATYYGPAFQIARMSGVIPAITVNAHVPIDEESIELRFAVMIYSEQEGRYHQLYSQAFIEVITEGYFQDVAIWEHKVWRDQPMLCDGDGPIGDLRTWYSQFYDAALNS